MTSHEDNPTPPPDNRRAGTRAPVPDPDDVAGQSLAVAAPREAAVLADGPWAQRAYWRTDLEAMQQASARMGYPDQHPSAALRAYRPAGEVYPHPATDDPARVARDWHHHPPALAPERAEEPTWRRPTSAGSAGGTSTPISPGPRAGKDTDAMTAMTDEMTSPARFEPMDVVGLVCPECGDDAVEQAPSGPTPDEAHGQNVPAYHHPDGEPLCPVVGPRGDQPATPVEVLADQDDDGNRGEQEGDDGSGAVGIDPVAPDPDSGPGGATGEGPPGGVDPLAHARDRVADAQTAAAQRAAQEHAERDRAAERSRWHADTAQLGDAAGDAAGDAVGDDVFAGAEGRSW